MPPALEITGPSTRVPSLDEIECLTNVPDRRIVFRDVDWSFYDRLVDSIPESSNIHVDYDGKDLEVMAKGTDHEDRADALGSFVKIVAEERSISYKSLRERTWKRRELARGIEADQCYYFDPEKMKTYARVRGLKDISLCPNPDMAIEVDISAPAVDRAAIYAALRVAEVWRFDGKEVFIEELTAEGKYVAVKSSRFLGVTPEEVRHWSLEEDLTDDLAWARKLRAEIRGTEK